MSFTQSRLSSSPTNLDTCDSLEKADCPLCGSHQVRVVLRAPGFVAGLSRRFPLSRCDSCGFVFSSPRVPPAEIGTYYGEEYFGLAGRASRRMSFETGVEEWLRILRTTHRDGEGWALDFGAGTGEFLAVVNASGWQSVGVEPTPNFRRRARSAAPHSEVFADLEELRRSRPSLRFDVVMLLNVLEHVPDPLAVLRQIRALMQPDGDLVIKVPSIGTWEFALCREHYYGLQLPHHYCQFTPQHLVKVLEAAGYVCCRLEHLPVSFLAMSRALWRGVPVFPLMQAGGGRGDGAPAGRIPRYSFGQLLARGIGMLNAAARQSPMIRAFARPRPGGSGGA